MLRVKILVITVVLHIYKMSYSSASKQDNTSVQYKRGGKYRFGEKRRDMYADRLSEFQELKEELGLYSSYREFIDTNVYNLNSTIKAIKTKYELFKDIETLDTVHYLNDPNNPYYEPFLPFDEELNGITFSCPICADEFCVNDVDTENLPVSVYIACKHVACNKCIEIMRKRFTCNPYHCPWCRQDSFTITPINDALLRQTVLFCEKGLRLKKKILTIHKKAEELKTVKKMNEKMLIDLEELQNKITYKLKQFLQHDLIGSFVVDDFNKTKHLKNRILSDYNNMPIESKKS
jgi:hypothetical protein